MADIIVLAEIRTARAVARRKALIEALLDAGVPSSVIAAIFLGGSRANETSAYLD
jgi:hypothetical protein